MTCKIPGTLIAIPILILSLSAQAHDPEEHMQGAEKPDCASMENMDHAKMDMNDPVIQAMMQKCKAQMTQGESGDSREQDDGENEHNRDENDGMNEHRHGN